MATETLVLEGRDSQGNAVTKTLAIPVTSTTPTARFYVGMSTDGDLDAEVAKLGRPIALDRFYQPAGSGWQPKISAAHSANRVPWMSTKPDHFGSSGGSAGWDAIAAGQRDASIRSMARMWAGYTRPVMHTFHHEPTNDVNKIDSRGAVWAAAFERIIDITVDEVGALPNLKHCICIGAFVFREAGRDLTPWLRPTLLGKVAAFTTDIYQNQKKGTANNFAARMGEIKARVGQAGFTGPWGIGEVGASNVFRTGGLYDGEQIPADPGQWTGAQWLRQVVDYIKADLAADPRSWLGVSYFDSLANSKVNWDLFEAKLAADTEFKADAWRELAAVTSFA